MPNQDDFDMHPCVSSNISQIGWLDNTLQVEFNNGGVYQYSGVSEDVYESMRDSASVGGYFGRAIKGVYPGKKVS